jgi:transglutaminase-like putative cysteine protease/tetratricopeptide (TPR) repeat protein
VYVTKRSAFIPPKLPRIWHIFAALGLAFWTPLAVSGEASAEVESRLGRLTQLRDDVLRARGPLVYAELRRLWREWDQGDPAEVEEVLQEIESDPGLGAPARAYAGLLEAYARRRRGDLDGARDRIARLGFINRWMVVGPFDNEGKAGFETVYGPEDERLAAPSLTRAYAGKERSLKWRIAPSASPYGWIDLGALLRPTEKICGYLSTYVRDARGGLDRGDKLGPRPVSVWAGSAGALRVFWNGAEALRDDKYRDLDADRFAAAVVLQPGWNRLLVKLCGDDAAPILSLRVAGADGGPDAHLEFDAHPINTADTGEGTIAPQRAKAVSSAYRSEGPIQAFERMVLSNDPTMLEAYSRYLVITQSDDPSEHRARELARRAAERAPTISRLLLAGGLAEGRNQQAVWIDRAEDLVKRGVGTPGEKIEALLARAGHVRGSSNWRDAVPLYDRILDADRDNVPAILGRFELFATAGLHETALALLSKALDRRPRSVALLRAMVGALRAEDRTTEAEEMEERYASLRFDDPSFAREHIDLALARRDAGQTTRWVERLRATNPDSASALGVAAHAFLALGDRPRAVATYRQALEMAPEDTDTMRALAEVYGMAGQRDEQTNLLREIVTLLPQSKDVREYLAHLEPSKPRADEAYARSASEFLRLRNVPGDGHNRRRLVDVTVTTVFPNGLASRFHQVVFQPMTESAAADAREYAFAFEADSESVQLRGARIYHASGDVDEAIESGEGPADNPALSTYTSARAFYVHFPRLTTGDVVELLYRVEDVAPRNAFADYFGETNYMQSDEPCARAEYILITPKARTFYFNKPNVPGITEEVKEQGDQRIYRFVAKDVPPIDPEPSAPPLSELLGHVHVSTYKSWDELAAWYWGLVKDQFVADDDVRRRVAEATSGLKDDRAKVRAIYDYVVQKTRYVALEFGIHGFKPYSCAQIFARGFGDCKDKATLLVTMLKELGIPATIVIVRSGMRGDFETEPASLAPFDHAIAYVPSLDLYLDGTAEYTGSTELPAMDRGALALQVNEGRAKLVHLPDPPARESITSRRLELLVGGDGSAQIDFLSEVTGSNANGYRQRYHAEVSRKQRITEDLSGDFAGLEILSVDAPDIDNVEEKVTLHVRARARDLGRKDGESMSIPVGPREHMVRDLAPLSQRKLDVRIHARTTTENDWSIHLPPEVHVIHGPVASEARSAFGTVRVDVEQALPLVHVKTTVTVDRSRIAASDYPALRAWCEAADRILAQRVVVSK